MIVRGTLEPSMRKLSGPTSDGEGTALTLTSSSLSSTSSYQRSSRGDLGSKTPFPSTALRVLSEFLSPAHSYIDIKMKSTVAVFLEEADCVGKEFPSSSARPGEWR